jgi:hypothetical protein
MTLLQKFGLPAPPRVPLDYRYFVQKLGFHVEPALSGDFLPFEVLGTLFVSQKHPLEPMRAYDAKRTSVELVECSGVAAAIEVSCKTRYSSGHTLIVCMILRYVSIWHG